jgi:hypothetical protein
MTTTTTPVTFLAQEIHHSASCLASARLVHEVKKLPRGAQKPPQGDSRHRNRSNPSGDHRRTQSVSGVSTSYSKVTRILLVTISAVRTGKTIGIDRGARWPETRGHPIRGCRLLSPEPQHLLYAQHRSLVDPHVRSG